ncbi:MAG: hypothetical protein ACI8XO_004286 [Verrucomicrobiales bacterium]|jgi:hypothetical protein
MMKYFSASFLCLLLFSTSGFAQFGLKTRSSLIADLNAIEPGQSFEIALKLTHPEHWHSYFERDGIGVSESRQSLGLCQQVSRPLILFFRHQEIFLFWG